MYDATARGVDPIAALHDQTRINAVVVLTDGDDNESRLKASQVIASLGSGARTRRTPSACSRSRTARRRTGTCSSRSPRRPAARATRATRRRSRACTARSRASSEMERLPVTRRVLAREIVLSAAKRPLNVAVAAQCSSRRSRSRRSGCSPWRCSSTCRWSSRPRSTPTARRRSAKERMRGCARGEACRRPSRCRFSRRP